MKRLPHHVVAGRVEEPAIHEPRTRRLQGNGPQNVVVRARGPSLTAAGVPNVLANPVLQLFSGQTQLAVNDNWQDAANAAQVQSTGKNEGRPH